MVTKHFSIVFCGGCNPKINRSQIAETLNVQLTRLGYKVSYNELDADFMVYLSGCSVSCAEQKKMTNVPFVVVAGLSIDSINFKENALATEILTRGRSCFERL
ncbi:MAG: hypothetical protein WCK63_12085 [Betaproteobacteria bacterium]